MRRDGYQGRLCYQRRDAHAQSSVGNGVIIVPQDLNIHHFVIAKYRELNSIEFEVPPDGSTSTPNFTKTCLAIL
jgi:hypothetical protein